jgi:hypothetical protein
MQITQKVRKKYAYCAKNYANYASAKKLRTPHFQVADVIQVASAHLRLRVPARWAPLCPGPAVWRRRPLDVTVPVRPPSRDAGPGGPSPGMGPGRPATRSLRLRLPRPVTRTIMIMAWPDGRPFAGWKKWSRLPLSQAKISATQKAELPGTGAGPRPA